MHRLMILPLSMMVLAACSDDNEDKDTDMDTEMMDSEDTETTPGDTEVEETDEPAPTTTAVRIVHLSPDAPDVDVWAEATIPIQEDLAFPTGTTYAEVPGGTYDIQIVAADGDPTMPAYEVEDLTLDNGVSYTAVAHGYLGGSPNPFAVAALVDDRDGISSSNFRVQVLHAAAATAFAQVDVWNVTDAQNPAPLIPDFDYGASVTTDLPTGQYTICLDVNDDAACDATFQLPDLPTGFYNLYATNDNAGNPFLVAHTDEGTVRLDPVTP